MNFISSWWFPFHSTMQKYQLYLSVFPVPGMLQRIVINSWQMTTNTYSKWKYILKAAKGSENIYIPILHCLTSKGRNTQWCQEKTRKRKPFTTEYSVTFLNNRKLVNGSFIKRFNPVYFVYRSFPTVYLAQCLGYRECLILAELENKRWI